jgi:hypothetical protein
VNVQSVIVVGEPTEYIAPPRHEYVSYVHERKQPPNDFPTTSIGTKLTIRVETAQNRKTKGEQVGRTSGNE